MAATSRQPGFLNAVAVARAATIERYGLDRRMGIAHFAGAALDPFVYAGVVYLVLTTAFGLSGAMRFHLILLGFIAFRWTLVSLLHAREMDFLRRRFNEHADRGLALALVAVMAPASAAFLAALVLAFLTSLFTNEPRSFGMVAALPAVIAVQAAWTAILILGIDWLLRRRIVIHDTTIIAASAVIWFLSPIMYLTPDVAGDGGVPFTRFNPVAYIMAAYHNAYWFGVLPTPTTILGAAVLAGGVLWLHVRIGAGAPINIHAPEPARAGVPHLVVQPPGQAVLGVVANRGEGRTVLPIERWRGRLPPVTGRGLAKLVIAARGHGRIEDVERWSAIGALLADGIDIYPEAARDQLATSLALLRPEGRLVLARTLDGATPAFVAAVWPELERRATQGDVVVLASSVPALPPGAHGTYKFVGSTGTIGEGPIAELSRAETRASAERPPS